MRSALLKIATGATAALIAGSLLVTSGCGGGLSTVLTEPEGDNMLLIGSCIVENVGMRNRQEYYVENIEVSFMSDVEIKGRMVRKAITIWAEDDGYFCVENVPNGKYTLKGIRIFSPGGEWTIWNELRMPNERWMLAGGGHYYSFTGEYFHFSPLLNVYNFGHNIFSVLPGGDVRYYNQYVMDGNKYHLADGYTRGFVEQYFIDKYPDSGWTPILRQLLPEVPPNGSNR